MSCNVDSHETVMSPALCAALYNLFSQNNALSRCMDVCIRRLLFNDAKIKHDVDGNVDKCYVDQLYLCVPRMHMATASPNLY